MPSPRRVAALLASALAAACAAVVAPATPAHAEEVYPRPASGVYVMDGHGWGHGRGLNQWGAQGAALVGHTYQQILGAYYPGTTWLTLPEAPIRVLIQDDEGTDTVVTGKTGLAFTDAATGRGYALGTARSRWRARVDASGFRVEGWTGSAWTGYRGPDGKTVFGGPVRFSGATPLRLLLPGGAAREYRGTITSVRNGTTAVATVNTLSLEHYLYGVVPRESPSYFHAEALKAQAVAARSYSAYKRDHAPAASPWDICSTTQCQVYGGMRHIAANGAVTELERATTNAAVNATARLVRAYGGKAIFAEFSSSNGGWSTTGNFPYLTAKADGWDRLESPHHTWTGQVSVAEIEARYPSVGRLVRLRVIERDGNGEWGGRVKRVLLDGVRSDGSSVTVEATGGGIFQANPWPTNADGIRGSWWKIRTSGLNSSVVTQTKDPTFVRPPGRSFSDVTVEMRNTGFAAWPVSGLHLAVAEPPGAPDPYAGGSTRPGVFAGNLDRASATGVAPGERALFRIRLDLTGKAAGTYRLAYRVRLGSGEMFGAVVRWTVYYVEPAFRAQLLDRPGDAVLARDGSKTIELRYRNTGNVTWPVGGDVRLGTSDPRGRTSPSSGAGWLSGSRVGALARSETVPGATGVSPGQVGVFTLPLHGNGRPAGSAYESFEPLWEGRAWLGGVARFVVVLTDPTAQRLAELHSLVHPGGPWLAYPASHPVGYVRLRNLGGAPIPLGDATGDLMVTAPDGRSSPFRHPSWVDATRSVPPARNLNRPGAADVAPGEVVEWAVPFDPRRAAAGTHTESFQAATRIGTRYGPVAGLTVRLLDATFTGSVAAAPGRWSMSRTSRKAVSVDVRNTGNAWWPVNDMVRLVPVGTTGVNGSQPVVANLSRPGSAYVRPGETARFTFAVSGNGRAAGTYSDVLQLGWLGWRWSNVRLAVTYTLTA